MFMVLLAPSHSTVISNSLDLSRSRSETLKAYDSYLEDYLDFAVKVATKSCLNSIAMHQVAERKFYSDESGLSNNISRCLLTGTMINISDSTSSISLVNSENRTIPKLLDFLVNLTEQDYDIGTNYTLSSLSLSQVEPELFQVELSMNYSITSDELYLKPAAKTAVISVDYAGTIDPMFSVWFDTIKYFDNIDLIGEPEYSADLYNIPFETFLERVSYVQFSNGTSAFNRFLNTTGVSTVSIISFINETDLNVTQIALTIPNYDKKNFSYVDVFFYEGKEFNECGTLYCLDTTDDSIKNCDANRSFRIDYTTLFSISTARTAFNLTFNHWIPTCED
jgi:hypothetical protein